jgi:aryl-alcohol dehydrogenase-like predicted oxidoreductase
MHPEVLEAVQRLKPIADQNGLTMSQLALAWVLRQDNVAAAIVGATKPDHVTGAAGAAGVKLSDDIVSAIDAALGDVADF